MSRGDWQRPNCRNCSSDLNCENCPQKSSLRKISSFSLFIECWRLQFHRWLRQSDCRIHFRIKRVFEARAEKVRNRRHLSRGASGGRRRVASRPGCGNNTVRRLRSSTLDNYISRRSRATFCRLGRRYASSFGYTQVGSKAFEELFVPNSKCYQFNLTWLRGPFKRTLLSSHFIPVHVI